MKKPIWKRSGSSEATGETAGEESRPEVIGPMLESHAGFHAPGPDDTFDVGAIFIGPEGRFLKHEFAWERLGDEDAAPEKPEASENEEKEKQ